jgi:hypothetical protein
MAKRQKTVLPGHPPGVRTQMSRKQGRETKKREKREGRERKKKNKSQETSKF